MGGPLARKIQVSLLHLTSAKSFVVTGVFAWLSSASAVHWYIICIVSARHVALALQAAIVRLSWPLINYLFNGCCAKVQTVSIVSAAGADVTAHATGRVGSLFERKIYTYLPYLFKKNCYLDQISSISIYRPLFKPITYKNL